MINLKSYFAGVGAYVACLLPAMLPIFQPPLDGATIVRLTAAAVMGCMLVAIVLLTGFQEKINDPDAKLTQGLLGIGVCAGLYAALVPVSEPQIVLMSLLWVAIGLTKLTPNFVLALMTLYLGIYLNAFTPAMLDVHGARHSTAVYTLVVSLVLGTFMYLRSRTYEASRHEKSALQDTNLRQAEELQDAEARILALTKQDMDTIALKYPFFKEELHRCRDRADNEGNIFSVGLVAIDHIDALNQRYGEMVMKQLTREVVDRITGVTGKMGLEEAGDGGFHPVGRVGEGLFGIIMPRANLKGAQAYAQQVHNTIEFQAFRTMAGLVNLTVTIGLAEYYPGESVDELMQLVGRSLEKARLHDMHELQSITRPPRGPKPAPVKAATGVHDLRILHEKEYEAQLH